MLAALLLLATLNPWEFQPRSLADCDARVLAHPREFEAWFCYMQVSFFQPKAEWERKTAEHLKGRVAAWPDDPFAKVMLALIDTEDDLDEPLYRSSAASFHAQSLYVGEVVARTALATDLCENGRFLEADEELRLSREAAEASGANDLLSQADIFDANCARAEADYVRSLALYQRARARLLANPETWRTPWLLGNALDGLGQLYALTGRHQEALEIFQDELEKRDPFMRSCAEHRVAEEAVRLARRGGLSWDDADGLLKTALDDEVKYGCHVYINGGEIYTRLLHAERLGPTEEGIAEVQRALELTRKEAEPIRLCRALRLLATLTIERDKSQLGPALAAVDEAIALAAQLGSRVERAESLMTRAHVQARAGDLRAALPDAMAALEQFDRLRELQPDAMVRARASTEWSSAYHFVAGLLLEEGAPPEQSFQTLERMRARSLLEQLDGPGAPGADSKATEPLRRSRQEVLAAIARTQRKLLALPLEDPRRVQALAEQRELESREAALREQLELARNAPADPAELANLALPALAEVQARLGEGEGMLIFQLFDREGAESAYLRGSSWVLAVSKAVVRAVRIPDAVVERLGGEVDLLAGLVARRDGSEERGARTLHEQLLDEALQSLGPQLTRLVVIPDGALHRLPFEALRDAQGRALGERFELARAPSAALLLRWRRTPTAPAPVPALALGDPSFGAPAPDAPARPPPGAGATPPGAGPTASQAIAEREWDLARLRQPLPGARDEALSLVRALGNGSEARLGPDATERFVKTADLRRFGILHIAAHARIDEVRPERSAILLAPGAPDEDGLLQLGEIGKLDLRGCAVVLATCSSSSGEVLQGEGVMSLARGFFQAGARAVVGSLWPLRDDDAALFFDAFYARLGEGATLDDAMATARRARIRAGAPAEAWAGLTLLGDGQSAPIAGSVRGPSAGRRAALATVAAGALFAALLGAALHRRRRRA